MRKPRFAWPLGLAVVVCVAFVAAGCGGGGSSNSSSKSYSSGNTSTGTAGAAGGTLRIAEGSEPPSLDPGFATDTTSAFVVSNINTPIVKLGPAPDLKPQPALAKSWDFNGKTVTLHLRNDVTWTDGTPV